MTTSDVHPGLMSRIISTNGALLSAIILCFFQGVGLVWPHSFTYLKKQGSFHLVTEIFPDDFIFGIIMIVLAVIAVPIVIRWLSWALIMMALWTFYATLVILGRKGLSVDAIISVVVALIWVLAYLQVSDQRRRAKEIRASIEAERHELGLGNGS
jgi:hypothetical protein